jgi:hypothetical protein
MNIISKVDKSLVDRINSEVYTDDKKTFKVSDKITIDWKGVLPEPPINTSEETIKELEYLAKLTKNVSAAQKNLIYLVDNEPLDLYNDILRQHNLEMPKKDFNRLWRMTKPVIMNLKYKFNRPRPEQLAKYYGLKINVLETKTHHTPAYPSGHTSYAAMGAYLLAEKYPKYSSSFFKRIGDAGLARCLQGVHYPSDNEAAMVISGAIWQDVRYKLFPNL